MRLADVNPIFLRACAGFVTALGSAAGVIAANPDLIKVALPPGTAAAVSATALVIVAVLHEMAHSNTAPSASAPADPAPPKETP